MSSTVVLYSFLLIKKWAVQLCNLVNKLDKRCMNVTKFPQRINAQSYLFTNIFLRDFQTNMQNFHKE